MVVICAPGLLFLCLHFFSFTSLKLQFILPLPLQHNPHSLKFTPTFQTPHDGYVHNASHEKAFMMLNFILLNIFFTTTFKIYILNIPTKGSRLKREIPSSNSVKN